MRKENAEQAETTRRASVRRKAGLQKVENSAADPWVYNDRQAKRCKEVLVILQEAYADPCCVDLVDKARLRLLCSDVSRLRNTLMRRRAKAAAQKRLDKPAKKG